jgi:hypothetical protein
LVVVVRQLLMVMVLLLQAEQHLYLVQFLLLVAGVVLLGKMVVVLPMGRLVDQAVVVDITALVALEILQVFHHHKEMLAAMLLVLIHIHQAVVVAQVPQGDRLADQHRAMAVMAQQALFLVLQ